MHIYICKHTHARTHIKHAYVCIYVYIYIQTHTTFSSMSCAQAELQHTDTLLQHTTAAHYCSTLLQHTPHSRRWVCAQAALQHTNLLLQHTTATHDCNTRLQHTVATHTTFSSMSPCTSSSDPSILSTCQCDMTHSYTWNDSSICVTWRTNVVHGSYVWPSHLSSSYVTCVIES